jgi:hypothetical protein
VLAAVAALALLASGGSASAAPTQESIMQSDHSLYHHGPVSQARTLDQMAALGVDTVHTLIGWRALSPDNTATKPPKGLRLDDPKSYPAEFWNPYDDMVRGALARGMDVLVTPTGPAPRWAEGCSASLRKKYNPGTCKPSAAKFGQFVEAIARRYSGNYADESDGAVLPAVKRWSFWNEGNLNSWLSPQTERVRRRTVLKGAAMYRSIVHSAIAGLRAGGHSRDQVLLGETAPIASGKKGTAPVTFYRALFCIDSKGKRLRGSAASAVGCSKRKRFPVQGIAHHPYTRGAGDSLTARQPANQVTIAYTSRLKAVVRQGESSGLVPKRTATKIYFTEFGVSTNPPAERFSVPLEVQAEWINQADYISYRDSAVRSVAQFGLEDDPAFERNTFQTGICFNNQPNPCFPKPSYDAYRVPIYVVKRGKNVLVYGHARPVTPTSRRLEIQNRATTDGPWLTVDTVDLSTRGHFLRTVPARPGRWRLVWTPAPGQTFTSREAVARKR